MPLRNPSAGHPRGRWGWGVNCVRQQKFYLYSTYHTHERGEWGAVMCTSGEGGGLEGGWGLGVGGWGLGMVACILSLSLLSGGVCPSRPFGVCGVQRSRLLWSAVLAAGSRRTNRTHAHHTLREQGGVGHHRAELARRCLQPGDAVGREAVTTAGARVCAR